MVSSFRQPTRDEIEEARRRLGLKPAANQQTGFAAAPPQVEESEEGSSKFGRIADGFRAIVPQGVRDAAGAVGQALDTPLVDRVGFRIPDDPLFLDEVGNFALQELTRPSTLAIAAGGAGAAGQLSRLGRAGELAANLVAPAGGSSFATRLASETAIGLGARAGGEATNRVLPEETPTPIRIALNLLGGAAGGVAALGATRSAVRSAVGEDLLSPQNIKPRITQSSPDLAPRKGNLLAARELDPQTTTLDDVFTEARNLERAVDSQRNALAATAEVVSRPLGKRVKDADGQTIFASIRKNDGSRAVATEVLEFPHRFQLTPEQLQAVEQVRAIPQQVRAESDLFGAVVKDADLWDDQNFIPRKAITDTTGVDVNRPKGGGGNRLSAPRERARTFADPAEGIAGGVVYEDPFTAIDEYASRRLTAAANEHVKSLLAPWSETSALRVPEGLRAQHDALAKRLQGLSTTAKRLDGRVSQTIDAYLNAAEPNLDNLADDLAGLSPKAKMAIDPAPSPKPRAGVTPFQKTTAADVANEGLQYPVTRGTALRDSALRGPFTPIGQARAELMGIVQEHARALFDKFSSVRTWVQDFGDKGDLRGALARGEDSAVEIYRASESFRAQLRALDPNGDGTVTLWRGQPVGTPDARQVLQSYSADPLKAGKYTGMTAKGLPEYLPANEIPLIQDRVPIDNIFAPVSATEGEILVVQWGAVAPEVVGRFGARLSAPTSSSLRGDLAGITVRGSGRNGGKDAAAIAEEIASVKAEIDQLRPGWRRAIEASKQVPAGRKGIAIDIAPALAGRDFPEDIAKRVERFYSRGKLPNNQVGTAARGVQAVNRTFIPLRAMGDMSSLMNQLALIAPSNPKVFFKNAYLATRDAFAPSHYDDYLRENAGEAAKYGTVIMRGGSKAAPEFTFSGWMSRIPGFKQAQTFFDSSTTRNRIDLFNQFVDIAAKSGEELTNTDKTALARSMNRLTGISVSRAGDVETLSTFAPNFLRAGIETVVKAGTDGTIEGQLARQYLRNFVVSGQVIALSAALAEGRDPREVMLPFDANALKNGQIRLNPNFGTVRVPGINQDISLYGRFDSLARLAVVGMDASARAISEQDALELFDALGFLTSTKGSPLVSFGTSLVTGSTFNGDDPLSAQNLVDQALPFTFSGFMQDIRSEVDIKTALGGGAINFMGGKSRELTAWEQLNNVSASVYNKTWDTLTGQEKQAIEDQFPALVKRTVRQQEDAAKRGDPKAKARLEFTKIDASRLLDEGKVAEAYQLGEIDTKQYADALDELQQRSAIQKQQAMETLGAEFADPSSGPAKALSDYFSTYDEAEVAPGVIDWEMRDKLEQELDAAIARGEYGDPIEARRYVDERRVTRHAPEVEGYFRAKQYISQAGYYDTVDAEYARFAGAASRIAGYPVETYGGLLKAIRAAEIANDRAMLARLGAIQNQVERRSSQARQRLRLQDPALDEALVAAKGLTPIRAQAKVSLR